MWTRRLRDEIGRQQLKYPELAKKAGIPVSTIKQYARQSATVANPRGDKMDRLADALGVTRRWLQTGEGPKHPLETNRGFELLDEALLMRLVELLEEDAAKRGGRLPPDKYARLVAYCYQQQLRDGARSAGDVEDAVRRALNLLF